MVFGVLFGGCVECLFVFIVIVLLWCVFYVWFCVFRVVKVLCFVWLRGCSWLLGDVICVFGVGEVSF